MARATLHPVGGFVPVDPFELLARLATGLGVILPSCPNAGQIIDQPFPTLTLQDASTPEAIKAFRDQYLIKEVLRKYPCFQLDDIDTRKAALDTLWVDESRNAETNARLECNYVENPRVSRVFDAACRKAVHLLGRFRPDWFVKGLRFGPGSTTRHTRRDACVTNKLTGSPHVNLGALALLQEVISVSPQWAYNIAFSSGKGIVKTYPNPFTGGTYDVICLDEQTLALTVCQFDKVDCVRKNAKTDRTIGIPPDGSGLLQLAMGYTMRRKMARYGINLNDQSINQNLAREASVHGRNATVDLRSASNSVTCSLVYRSLGNHSRDYADLRWYDVLEAIRTPVALVDGKLHEWQLFSAMGNGCTFELESLIFWAIAHATCDELDLPTDEVSVYGDDLIVPCAAFDLLKEVLAYAGFLINEDKTFHEAGPLIFRESCGGHYVNGVDVSPFYVDGDLENPENVLLLANNLMRWSTHEGYRDARVLDTWAWVVAHLPDEFRACVIPPGEENDGLVLGWDEVVPCNSYIPNERGSAVRRTHIGYKALTLTFKARERLLEGQDGYIARLYGWSFVKYSPFMGKKPVIAVREYVPLKVSNQKSTYRLGRRIVTTWDSLPQWADDRDVYSYGSHDLELIVALARLSLRGRKTHVVYIERKKTKRARKRE